MITLRPYQSETVRKMLWDLGNEGNSVICIGQGGGKSLIIAEFVRQLNKPVLILVPSKELLEQDLDELSALVDDVGVFSASMNSKIVRKITIGTIQSVYKSPEQFAHYGVVLVDEADEISPKNIDGMYTTFFKAIGLPKVFGLTATPFRLDVMYKKWGPQRWMLTAQTTTKMITRM